jgi:DNA phosphorothioation-dependent restriction protein DptH
MLGSIVGRHYSLATELNALYVPDGVRYEISEGIVRRANGIRQQVPPLAILVNSRSEDLSDPACLQMSANSAIRYRQDDRLAVVAGKRPDLASFVQAFQDMTSQTFPEETSSLSDLAATAIAEIADVSGLSTIEGWDRQKAANRLADAITLLSNIYKDLRQGGLSWDAYWWNHVDLGIRALVDLIESFEVSERPVTIDELFSTYTYAVFGLPTPHANVTSPYPSARYVEAYQNYWSDGATIESTAALLANHVSNESTRHPVQHIDWASFDEALAGNENVLMAFVTHISTKLERIENFARLTDTQFVNPFALDGKPSRLTFFTASGRSLAAGVGSFQNSYFVARSEIDPGLGLQMSETVKVLIPTLRKVEADEASRSAVSPAGNSSMKWIGSLEVDEAGALWAVGGIERKAGKSPFRITPRLVKLSVSIPQHDVLDDAVDPTSVGELYLIPSETPGVLYAPINAQQRIGKPKYAGVNNHPTADGTERDPVITTLDATASSFHFLVWSSRTAITPLWEGVGITPLEDRPSLFSVAANPAKLSVLLVDEQVFEFRAEEAANGLQSPILAAVFKRRVTPDRPDQSLLDSIRGTYEQFISQGVLDASVASTLGHLITPEDSPVQVQDFIESSDHAFLMPKTMLPIWDSSSDIVISAELLQSSEADEFRRAFWDLKLDHLFKVRSFDGAEFQEIPSKTSYRKLWVEQKPLLRRYLDTYSDLVDRAKSIGDSAGIFWATYPFSVSVWKTESSAKCSAVLLSPLHPLRLAWLAGVESTLWNSDWAGHLVGTIEGWNLPLIGPKETGGKMLAVAAENGDGQLFLGWSMLVSASIDGHEALSAPERIGELSAPATAASGLNSSAVTAALRNYRQMNPHISTISIDLAATSAANRFAEVDDAVLTSVGGWMRPSSSRLIGGARISDSTKRAGDPPRDKLARLIRASDGSPLTWTRYTPNNQSPVQCNVRILQDAGVEIKVEGSGTNNLGIIGQVPLRRFEAVTERGGTQSAASSSPTILPDGGWDPFGRALRVIENAASRPRVLSKLYKATLINDSAEWTISGESLMSPSAMATVVQHTTKGAQMLWEWRPPFLEPTTGTPVLEQRPFVSVARIPQSFKNQVRALVSKAREIDVDDDAVNNLLGKLGSRGVGLSSLLSMGGSHASGALGFYLTFGLMDAVSNGSADTFVLPIDACDTFLKALAKGGTNPGLTRRADILIVRILDESITLAPVEIKFYGLANEVDGTLPRSGSSLLDEALDQVQQTRELLTDVAESWTAVSDGGSASDRSLWANGLGTLVEAAIRLRPGTTPAPSVLAKRLESLISGEMNVVAGKPLVCYFKHKATTATAGPFYAEVSEDSEDGAYGLLSSNAGAAFEALEVDSNDLVRAWSRLVDWALESPLPEPPAKQAVKSPATSSNLSPNPQETTDARGRSRSRIPETEPINARRPGPVPRESHVEVDAKPNPDIQRDIVPSRTGPSRADETSVGIQTSGVRFVVGDVAASLGKNPVSFWPSNTELNQMNVGVVGDLGTGKTQLLKSLVYQLRDGAERQQETPLSFLVFDYKEDFQSDVFLQAVNGKVLKPYRIPVNIFALRGAYSPLAAYQRAQQFVSVLDKIYGNIGPIQADRLVTSIVELFKSKGGVAPTLAEVLASYSEDQKADAVIAILKPFVLGEIFSDDAEEMMSFEELLNDRVLVVALNEFGTDDNGKNALVVLFLNLYYDYMLNSTKWPYSGSDPQLRRLNSFLLVDEAVNIMKYNFPVLMQLMLQGREYGVGVILASQYLDHFRKDSVNYGQPLLTWFIHKVPSVTVKELQQLGLPNASAEVASKIPTLKVHQALYSSLDVSGQFINEVPFFRLVE